jgi:hypothetical protein
LTILKIGPWILLMGYGLRLKFLSGEVVMGFIDLGLWGP